MDDDRYGEEVSMLAAGQAAMIETLLDQSLSNEERARRLRFIMKTAEQVREKCWPWPHHSERPLDELARLGQEFDNAETE